MASLPAEGIIEAAAITEVTAIEGMTVGLCTAPRGTSPILDADEVILDEDPIPGVLPTLIHLGGILTGHDPRPVPIGGTDPIIATKPDPYRDLMEGVAIILGVTIVGDP